MRLYLLLACHADAPHRPQYRLGWDGMMVALVLGLCVYFPFQLAFADIHPVRHAAEQRRSSAPSL